MSIKKADEAREPAAAPPKRIRKIISFGVMRSGSTLVWRMTTLLDPDAVVTKTHAHHRIKRDYVTATIRDFRDAMASLHRVTNARTDAPEVAPMTYQQMMAGIECMQKQAAEVRKQMKDGSPLLLRYEDFYADHGRLYDRLAAHLRIDTSRLDREAILKACSLETAAQVAREFKDFSEYDAGTQIHGCHIGDVKPGIWKKYVLPKFHFFFNQSMRGILTEFGYSAD